jgi:hypothetical protein
MTGKPRQESSHKCSPPSVQTSPTRSRKTTYSKPLAAYILGFNSVTVRLWQRLFWEQPSTPSETLAGSQTWDGVPLTLDELEQATLDLLDEIHPNLPAEIRRLVGRLRKQNERWLSAAEVPAKRETFFGPTKRLPGEKDWQNLVSITERALADASKWKPWLTLGQALGHYVADLYPSHGACREPPDLGAVIERARALNEAGVTIPEIKRLAECEVDKQQDCPLRLLGRILGVQDREPQSEADPMVRYSLFTDAWSLHERLRSVLDAQPETGMLTKCPPRPEAPQPFVCSPLQKGIMDALDGCGLNKTKLADLVCGGDGSRLYKTNGIKELKELGLVVHKRGVGYYRPDAPPEDLLAPEPK